MQDHHHFLLLRCRLVLRFCCSDLMVWWKSHSVILDMWTSDLGYWKSCPSSRWNCDFDPSIYSYHLILPLQHPHRILDLSHASSKFWTLCTMLDLAKLTATSALPLLGPHLPTLVISTLACFTIQYLSHVITPRILGSKWDDFDKKTRKGWASHCVCMSPPLSEIIDG